MDEILFKLGFTLKERIPYHESQDGQTRFSHPPMDVFIMGNIKVFQSGIREITVSDDAYGIGATCKWEGNPNEDESSEMIKKLIKYISECESETFDTVP